MNDVHLITITVNGQPNEVAVEARRTLADVLRHDLGHTGTHVGCEHGICGACTVILDGDPVYSCTTLAISCREKAIETVEGFDAGEQGVPHAFHQKDALMCGYCTPGFVTACKAFLDKHPGQTPTLEDVKRGLDGNICRCGTYIGVFQAALDAAKAMKGA